MSRIISFSAAPYDGWELPVMLESLARCGVTHVEPAYIVGYTEPFDESAFSQGRACAYRRALHDAGIGCLAMSSHIDLGMPDSIDIFRNRIDFAAGIGASIINTNAAVAAHEAQFFRNMETLGAHAEKAGIVIALENPGDGQPSLINTGEQGKALVSRIGSPWVGLNFDPGNLPSHDASCDPVAEMRDALPACAHCHIKNVRRHEDGWSFHALGAGGSRDAECLALLAEVSALPFAVELPLRMRRGIDAAPWRRVRRLELAYIEERISDSLTFVRDILPGEVSVA
ncbi:sugar phosphate isomerase/epimerase [Asaia sp. W19]|uniref:sugar phosphate isomerase/epimerase family protein n=1 Tax=unclassified Asaia TaxID=2685023 RepID=UPI000F8C3409|nr:sugar phosphate isomerase/epimerase family protein [Asaia sp. W19]RUT26514.1 sugar phosphate isomerase/epimerase [Asaia sp. W19]